MEKEIIIKFIKDEEEVQKINNLLNVYYELKTEIFKKGMAEAIIRYVKEIDKNKFKGCKGRNIKNLREQFLECEDRYNKYSNTFNEEHAKCLLAFFKIKKYNIACNEILQTYLDKEKYLYIDNFINHYIYDNNLENNDDLKQMLRLLTQGRFDNMIDTINEKLESEE